MTDGLISSHKYPIQLVGIAGGVLLAKMASHLDGVLCKSYRLLMFLELILEDNDTSLSRQWHFFFFRNYPSKKRKAEAPQKKSAFFRRLGLNILILARRL